jgi:hypothetical protein
MVSILLFEETERKPRPVAVLDKLLRHMGVYPNQIYLYFVCDPPTSPIGLDIRKNCYTEEFYVILYLNMIENIHTRNYILIVNNGSDR